MSLLSPPRCPQCSGDVPLEALWRVAPTNRQNYLAGDFGIQCPQCGARLRILQGRASWGTFLLLVAAMFLACGVAEHLEKVGVLPKGSFLGAAVLVVILSWPVTRSAPRLVTLRLAYDGEILEYPLDTVATSNNRWRGP
jgi:hypothetical protein